MSGSRRAGGPRRAAVLRVATAAVAAIGMTAASAGPAGASWWWPWPWPAAASQSTPSPGVALMAEPSPSPSPDPSPDPSASPSASPSPTPSPASSASPSPSSSPSPTPSPSPSPSVPARRALPAPGTAVAVLRADALQITGLQSIAVRTVQTGAGPVKVIELDTTATNIDGLDLTGPCAGHTQVRTTARQDRAAGLRLDATAIQVTVLGVPVILAAADLPEGQLTLPGVSLPPLPTDAALLAVRMFVLAVQAGQMALDGAAVSSTAC